MNTSTDEELAPVSKVSIKKKEEKIFKDGMKMTTQTINGAMNQRLAFEFQSLSPRMSMQARGTAGYDASTLRNNQVSQSLNSKTYSTVRGSVPLPRPV